MSLSSRLVRGALGGLIATIPMTATIYGGKQLGLLFAPPPQEITRRTVQQTHAYGPFSSDMFQVSWLAAHFGFGAAAGAMFGLMRPLFPASPALSGLTFGGVVWGLFYTKVLPDLGLYPPPQDDRVSRTATMIAAHGVYGVVTALLYRALPAATSLIVDAAETLPEIAYQQRGR